MVLNHSTEELTEAGKIYHLNPTFFAFSVSLDVVKNTVSAPSRISKTMALIFLTAAFINLGA